MRRKSEPGEPLLDYAKKKHEERKKKPMGEQEAVEKPSFVDTGKVIIFKGLAPSDGNRPADDSWDGPKTKKAKK